MRTSPRGLQGPIPPPPSAFVVVADAAGLQAVASALARRLGLPLLDVPPASRRPACTSVPGHDPTAWCLAVTSSGLQLRPPGVPRRRPLTVDWSGTLAAELSRPGAARALPLARAVGACRPDRRVLDATAGLGRDAFRLAALGATVVAAERSPIVAALLADGLARASADPRLAALLGARLEVHATDARTLLLRPPAPDVVLIDPMYPDAGRSALPRGEMQVLRGLLGPDEDADALFVAARAAARERVVVKRHALDPPLAGATPDRRIVGRSTRFDVYLARPVPTDA